MEIGYTISLEQNNFYYRRDLISTTKGVILKRFADGRFNVGLYKQCFQFLTSPVGFGSFSAHQMIESPQTRRFPLTGGGRQVQMTFRINLDSGACKISLARR